jgi:hypothetical protein
MTIEFSLRNRARQARLLAIIWLGLATIILVATFISLPYFAQKTLSSINKLDAQSAQGKNSSTIDTSEAKSPSHMQPFAIGTLTLGVLVISFACFMLGRTAFVEIEQAGRFNGIADALCIAGDKIEQLEKTVSLLVPTARYLSVPEIFSLKNIQDVADLVKQVRPK